MDKIVVQKTIELQVGDRLNIEPTQSYPNIDVGVIEITEIANREDVQNQVAIQRHMSEYDIECLADEDIQKELDGIWVIYKYMYDVIPCVYGLPIDVFIRHIPEYI